MTTIELGQTNIELDCISLAKDLEVLTLDGSIALQNLKVQNNCRIYV